MTERLRWEYSAHKAEGDLLSALKPLGEQGWELIAVMQYPEIGGVFLMKRIKLLVETDTSLLTTLTGVPPG